MLPFIVILLAVIYFVMQYAGVFEEVADFMNRLGNRSGAGTGTRSQRTDEQKERLKVFEDFFGVPDDNEEPGEDS